MGKLSVQSGNNPNLSSLNTQFLIPKNFKHNNTLPQAGSRIYLYGNAHAYMSNLPFPRRKLFFLRKLNSLTIRSSFLCIEKLMGGRRYFQWLIRIIFRFNFNTCFDVSIKLFWIVRTIDRLASLSCNNYLLLVNLRNVTFDDPPNAPVPA